MMNIGFLDGHVAGIKGQAVQANSKILGISAWGTGSTVTIY